MEFTFNVGQGAQHSVTFFFDQVWGRVRIKVDGNVVKKKLVLFSLKTTKQYPLTVGTSETHQVVIEQIRKRWFGGFRDQRFRVLVDGNLLEEH